MAVIAHHGKSAAAAAAAYKILRQRLLRDSSLLLGLLYTWRLNTAYWMHECRALH